jgi:putative DNA primase/helicase
MQQVCLDGQEIFGQAIAWGKRLEGTARELLAEIESSERDSDTPARDDAERWLAGLLADGPMEAEEVRRLAEVTGRSWRTVTRAKAQIRIVSGKSAMTGRWSWQLPKSATEDCHTRSVASFGKSGGFAEECHVSGVAPFGTAGTLQPGETEQEV